MKRRNSETLTQSIRADGDIAYVTLTKGYEAIIDAADIYLVKPWHWQAQPKTLNSLVYACRGTYVDGKHVTIRMHRALLDAPPDLHVDHINHNTLDNRRVNLRICTNAENLANRFVLGHKNTTGFRGIYPLPNGRWRTCVSSKGKHISLGVFDTAIEASDVVELFHKTRDGAFYRNPNTTQPIRVVQP